MLLVTGGAGYIGSHTCIELIHAGYDIVILDNLSNSNIKAIARTQQIVGKKIRFVEGDIRDKSTLTEIFKNPIQAVVHFAGLKAVGESIKNPIDYYINNVNGTLCLLDTMREHNCKNLIFSSSATVYHASGTMPLLETSALGANNPYGRSKLIVEEILRDLEQSDPSWRIATLRYFNPVGAHESGLIGENPNGIPNNLMPFIAQVAIGKRDHLNVFGQDYPTHDGTGVRDYIHVCDLATGHLRALDALKNGSFTVNLGTGRGYSVLDMIHTFSSVNQCEVPYQVTERRPGDVAECWASPTLAQKILNWRATRTLEDMCRDTWRWQQNNPNGYR